VGRQGGDRGRAEEAVVDNGGDIYLQAVQPVVVSLGTGTSRLADRLAFRVEPEDTPLSICSSSGKMGHSMSLGRCDLATVVAKDAALADAAATRRPTSSARRRHRPALERIKAIRDVSAC
jgi:ApbE superfamily uncharacterized protein (UPF0280 family)